MTLSTLDELQEYIDKVATKHPEAAKTIAKTIVDIGIMEPVFDAETSSYFVSNGGFDIAFSAMYFAKISTDGTELARYRTRSFVRCAEITGGGQQVVLGLDKKYLFLDIHNLQLLQSYDKHVPRYSDQIHVYGDAVYSINRVENTLRVYDLVTQAAHRIALPGIPKPIYSSPFKSKKSVWPAIRAEKHLLYITTRTPALEFLYDMNLQKFVS